MKLKFLSDKHLLLILSLTATGIRAQHSPYLTRVLEFVPAPGQFVNELPEYESGDTPEDMRRKAESWLAGNARSMVCLGGFGGYIVVGFDHTIANVPGEYDFKVYGNAFYADANPQPGVRPGGSCEPGVIQVSYDANRNGVADDPWYEIAGSEYGKPETIREYRITYYRPDPAKAPVTSPDQPHMSDLEYIRWTDNQGGSGFIPKNIYHSQSYYPEWIAGDQFTFTGTRLADNGADESGEGNNFVLYAYDYGYADNHPNSSEGSNIKIDWAVGANGEPVDLPGIDFIRIHTGVRQNNGWLGECSTEVLGVEDLHPELQGETGLATSDLPAYKFDPHTGCLRLELTRGGEVTVSGITGVTVYRRSHPQGVSEISLATVARGVYVVATPQGNFKIVNY